MQADGIGILFEEFRHLALTQPDGFVIELDHKAGLPVIGLVELDVLFAVVHVGQFA
jgi:hypothetical protein